MAGVLTGGLGKQVSPPQEDILGKQWWTRYQPVSYKIFSRSGDRAMFQEMVKTCREAGVDIVVDGVLNHMANSAGASPALPSARPPSPHLPVLRGRPATPAFPLFQGIE